MVINFDIPWNPVRVIQRLGRINRISKKVFDELNIVNFFPTEFGASLVKSREIAMNKMFLIHAALGEDSKIFDIDELPSAAGLYQRILQNPDSVEMESFYTRVLREFKEMEMKHPDVIKSLETMPPRVKVAKVAKNDKLFVIYKKFLTHHIELWMLRLHVKRYSQHATRTGTRQRTPYRPQRA
jgi:hypothetical protein